MLLLVIFFVTCFFLAPGHVPAVWAVILLCVLAALEG